MTIPNIDKDIEQLELLYVADSRVNGTSSWENTLAAFLKH